MTSEPRPLNLERLADIMARLRAPDGCPWDREQTLLSLKPWLLEETQEVLDVMDGPADLHCEELGDLLFQVVFQSQIRKESGDFDIADVIAGIADKLERRHPHVFGTEIIDDPAVVATRWEAIKQSEGKNTTPSDIPRDWSALMRAQKAGSRASRRGFDWPDVSGPLAKIHEEAAEVEDALSFPPETRAAALHHEIGDLLFAVVNVARHLGVSAEAALHDATSRFAARVDRVNRVLDERGLNSTEVTATELDLLWERHKHDVA